MSEERTAAETARAVNARDVSALELAREMAARIRDRDGVVGAYLAPTAELAELQARRVDARIAAGETLPLAGVPLAVKDNMCLAGTPTTCASRILEGWIAPYTATAVARLLAAGAVPVGKTNLDEFAMGSSCENSALGVTRNPWDLGRVPGGRSDRGKGEPSARRPRSAGSGAIRRGTAASPVTG